MYGLTPAQTAFQQSVRAFAEEELRPAAPELDAAAAFPHQIVRRCGELGLLNVLFSPRRQPGCRDAMDGVIVMEEVSRVFGSLGLILCPQYQCCDLLAAGAAPALRESVLAPALAGEKILALAISEESGGTTSLGITTTATPDGDTWIIQGGKCWITSAGAADGYVISAKTASASQRRSISFFYVDRGDPGLVVDAPEKMLGLSSSAMGNLRFDRCRVPADRLIGERNGGYELLTATLRQGRLQLGAVAVGIARRALELALSYSNQRVQYNRRLSSFQGVSFTTADMYARISAARSMLYHVAWLCNEGRPYTMEASALKLFANEVCCDVCQKSQGLQGAFGLSKRAEIERCLRDSHMLTAAEGTMQACKIAISNILSSETLESFP